MFQRKDYIKKVLMKVKHTRVWVSGWWHPRIHPTDRLLHQPQASFAHQFLFQKQNLSME